MLFTNREEAARLLASRLSQYQGQHPLVLGVPRGAVPMSRIIADALDGEMDVVLVHKLRAPHQPELAIGAIDETGESHLSEYVADLEIRADYIESEKRAQLAELRRRRRLYTPVRPPINPAGRIVVIVDDGIATGASILAAIRCVRARKPARLIVATAVAPPDTLRKIETEADEVICLEAPTMFYAVGQFFEDFSPVSDEEVVRTLAQAQRSPVSSAAGSTCA
jgi:predicted phosphoribosyltransferase